MKLELTPQEPTVYMYLGQANSNNDTKIIVLAPKTTAGFGDAIRVAYTDESDTPAFPALGSLVTVGVNGEIAKSVAPSYSETRQTKAGSSVKRAQA